MYPALLDGGVKVLVYSGNTDAAVPFTDTLRWIIMLDLEIEEKW